MTPTRTATPTSTQTTTRTQTQTPTPTPTATSGWNLVWSDEFNGPAGIPPNEHNWTPDVGDSGWGNNEWEYYTNFQNNPENAHLDGQGHLIIKAEALSTVPSDVPSCSQTSITGVTAIGSGANQTVTISGCGFGSHQPYNSDSYYLDIHDNNSGPLGLGWDAGYGIDSVTTNVTSWTDKQIVIGGFTGQYGNAFFGWAFNPGDHISVTVWNPQTWNGLTCSTPRCSATESVIQSQSSTFSSFYVSARLKTQGLQSFQYGRIEAAIQLPYGQGIWPAFWMLGNSISSVGWPNCGEIDMMEHINSESWIQGTVHGPTALGASNVGGQTSDSFDQGYHVFAIEWDQDQNIQFFVDDPEYQNPYFSVSSNTNYPYRWVFDQPFFILLNVAIGGNFPGNPDATTFQQGMTQEMDIDYVRVYQRAGAQPQLQPLPSR